MAINLIDATKENACRTAEANAIRAKTGGSTPITYDFANGKGFADAIAAITTGMTPSAEYTFEADYSARDGVYNLFTGLVAGNTDRLAIWITKNRSPIANELTFITESAGNIISASNVHKYKSTTGQWDDVGTTVRAYANVTTMERYVLVG